MSAGNVIESWGLCQTLQDAGVGKNLPLEGSILNGP